MPAKKKKRKKNKGKKKKLSTVRPSKGGG